MKKTALLQVLLFLGLWLVFSYASGVFDHIGELPRGVHQSAQCDRASLAQNYYYGQMRFFYPEVNEDRCTDGIVSCEMPLGSYLAAFLYRLFGYDEYWFRLLTWIFFSAGMTALFLLFRTRMHFLTAAALVLLLQSSPVLLFYGAGFLPDVLSLGLVLMAWLLFFRLYVPHPWLPVLKGKAPRLFFVLCLGLAAAVKTTSMIQWMSMAGLTLFSFLPGKLFRVEDRKQLLFSLFWSMLIPLAWHLWSRHLGQTHNAQYFMMRVPLSPDWRSYEEAWAVYLANWPPQALSDPLIYLAVGLMLLTVFLKRFMPPELWLLSVLNSLGSFAFLFLMIEQFKYHDYYVICLFPSFGLNWLALSSALNRFRGNAAWLKLLLFAGLLTALNFQFHRGRINLSERYTEGNYWEQSHHRAADLDSFRHLIRKEGVRRGDCSVVGYDVSPNDMLYLLHLRGHRFSKDHDSARLAHILDGSKPRWLVSNDSALSAQISAITETRFRVAYKNLTLYELRYSSKSR